MPDGREQNQEITTLTKFVLDQVYSLIQDGEMYKAKMEFIKIYDEYKAEAQLKENPSLVPRTNFISSEK